METNDQLKMNLISVNVRGIHSHAKRINVFQWLKKMKVDMFFLQETYSSKETETYWKLHWKGKIIQAHGTNHSKGVAILIKDNVDIDIISSCIDDEGRFICLNTIIQDQPVLLMNVYAPCSSKASEQLKFFTNVLDIINTNTQRHPNSKIIIGGDFNILMNIRLDRYGGNPVYNEKVMAKVFEIMENFDLIDIWRVLNPHLKQYTWRQSNPLIQSRLDYWLISDGMQDLIKKVDIRPAIKTDHSAIFLSLDKINTQPHGPSYWKFNDSLCNDKDYNELLRESYINWSKKYHEIEDCRILWEILKYEIRNATQSYSKKKSRERGKVGQTLENNAREAESNLSRNPSEEAKEKWLKAKNELDQHHEYTTQGIITRSRATWYEKGEKSNTFFLNLEKANKCKSTIRKVLTDDNQLITNSNDVMKEIKSFYTCLYTNKNVDFNSCKTRDFFNNDNIKKLSEDDKDKCDGKLTNGECFKALNDMADGKSPGNDGLTSLFYKTFWDLVGDNLVGSLNTGVDKGELSNSQKQGVITLILKKGKDKRKIANYRPITLLNVDLKIGSKAIANRITKIMPQLIGIEQTAFVEGRYIGDAVRTVADVLYYTKDKHVPGILMCIDFEKAYDSVDHNFLHKIIKVFNFGESFQNWIKVFYSKIESCVMNNGVSTGYFNIRRGLRQGDPLSCQLFNLVIQILCSQIHSSKSIQGIAIGNNKEVKLSVYADDMCMFLSNANSANKAFEVLNNFQQCSSMKINVNKTEAMWIGSARHNNGKHGVKAEVIWTTVVKILGIYFTYNDKDMIKLNYCKKLNSLKCCLSLWRHRDLSVIGKITVVKTFAISQFLYTSSVISMPIDIQNQINNIIYKFIWNGPDRMKRRVLCKNYDEGGLKMIDLKSRVETQNIMWLKRLIMPNEAGWKDILMYYMTPIGGMNLLKCNFDVKNIYCKIPPFYKEALKIWAKLNAFNPTTTDHILNQCVWNNKYILIEKKTVYYSKFDEAGFHTLYDFIDDNGKWLKCPNDKGFNNVDYIKWYGLIHAIPQVWKQIVKNSQCIKDIKVNDQIIECKLNNDYVPLEKVSSRNLYHTIAHNLCTPTSEYTLNTLYGINGKECKQVFMIPFRSTICSKSRWLQYRIIHGILTTNSWLYRIGKVRNPTCPLCNTDSETIKHLYAQCPITNSLWGSIESRITIIPKLNSFMKVYGVIDKDVKHVKLVNQILITARRCIYKCHCDGTKPTYRLFKNMLEDCRNIELVIAKSNNTTSIHYSKWDIVLTHYL